MTRSTNPPSTMETANCVGDRHRGIKSIDPPLQGYALQYERLLMEEIDLQKARRDILKSERSRVESSTPPTADGADRNKSSEMIANFRHLKVRGIFHRAFLEGLLISGQYAADKAKSGHSVDVERGLEREEARKALAALC